MYSIVITLFLVVVVANVGVELNQVMADASQAVNVLSHDHEQQATQFKLLNLGFELFAISIICLFSLLLLKDGIAKNQILIGVRKPIVNSADQQFYEGLLTAKYRLSSLFSARRNAQAASLVPMSIVGPLKQKTRH